MLHPDLIVGTETGDDAAVWRRPDGRALVTTVDFFAPVVDDAYTWGRVAAANAASDVYAMGGTPLFALNIAVWPRDTLPLSLLTEVLQGGAETARRGGWVVTGGHTVDGPEPMFGQVVVGELDAEALTRNVGAQAGDVLVLTKPLGTGLLATAHKHLAPEAMTADGEWGATYAAAIDSMTQLNDVAAYAGRRAGVHAATDVTGFGLAGHLHKMLRSSGVSASLSIGDLPLLPGARELVAAGFAPGGTQRNLDFVGSSLVGGSEADRLLVGDPQTSGGLLMACPADAVRSLVAELQAHGRIAAVIGVVKPGRPGRIALD